MITVIIPAYNRPEELTQALDSLVSQTYHDFQVMVVDDASQVDLQPVIDSFKDKLTIKYIKSGVNQGCGGNRNFALTKFKEDPTDHFMFMDSDDMIVPHAMYRFNLIIQNAPDVDIVVSDIIIESHGPQQGIHQAGRNETWLHGKVYRSQFVFDHNVNFCKNLATNEDLSFNLTLFAYDPKIYELREQLYLWRQLPTSLTHTRSDGGLLHAKCNSIDYIDCIYEALKHYPSGKLTSLMTVNVLNCYNHYQLGKTWGVITDRTEQRLKLMLHHEDVQRAIVQIHNRRDFNLVLNGWTVKGDNLVFYNQTFGQWLMQYFTQNEINQMIKKYYYAPSV